MRIIIIIVLLTFVLSVDQNVEKCYEGATAWKNAYVKSLELKDTLLIIDDL